MGRLFVLIALALAVPAPADACTCGAFDRPTVETCRTAKRVFAGTVASYHWPTAYDRLIPERAGNGVALAVDRVWRGDIGASFVAMTGDGGGDCGIHPLPGTRFTVCDDKADDEPPDFMLCSAPAFDAPGLEAALGPASAPRISLGGQLPWWRSPMLVPLVVIAVFALIGRRMRREAIDSPPRYRSLLAGLVACAVATVALRAVAHLLDLPKLAGLGPVALACCSGAWLGFRGQQRPQRFAGWFGGLVAAIACAALAISLGYARLHVPWDLPGAVACSRQRAEALLAGDDPVEELLARQPHACTDWGMARYRPVPGYRCLSFADGDGGEWTVCRDDGITGTFIGAERW